MPRQTTAYLPELEWEGLQVPYTIALSGSAPHLPPGTLSLDLVRDERYRIKGTARGEIVSHYNSRGSTQTGDLASTISITVADQRKGYRYELEGYRGSYSENYTVNERPHFTVDLILHRVRRRAWRYKSMQPSTLVEWYLNGSRDLLIYGRSIVRKRVSRYSKQLMGSDRIYPTIPSSQEYHTGAALITWADRCCVIQQVPPGCGPEWSESVGIEYRADWGGLPTPEERESIREIISFVIGRRLIHVGTTTFTKAGRVIEEESIIPWGSNAPLVCQRSGLPPASLRRAAEDVSLESVLQRLIPAYLTQRETLGLRGALWRYWIARESDVPETALPIVAAGLEGIADRWIDSQRSETTKFYLSQERWKAITDPLFPTIRAQLAELSGEEALTEGGQKSIMSKLDNAYFLSGVNEKRRVFLTKLDLTIGKVEKKAFEARNKPAHGAQSDDFDEMIHNRNAYDTLFNRVILKILGYDGTYTDRSARGSPETPIDQPLAGWSA